MNSFSSLRGGRSGIFLARGDDVAVMGRLAMDCVRPSSRRGLLLIQEKSPRSMAHFVDNCPVAVNDRLMLDVDDDGDKLIWEVEMHQSGCRRPDQGGGRLLPMP